MTNARDRPNFSRVKLRIKVSTKLKRVVKFVDEHDRVIDQKVQYEWELVLCSKCSMFEHEDTFCRGSQPVRKV